MVTKKFKIKLIFPPNLYVVPDIKLPYGMGVLSAFLKSHGYKVEIEDLSVFSRFDFCVFKNMDRIQKYLLKDVLDKKIENILKRLVARLELAEYGLIGFSILSYYQLYPALLIAKYIKKINKKITIVFGGAYVNLYGRQFFDKFSFIDYIVKGAGEVALLRLVEYYGGSGKLADISGLVYRENNKIYENDIEEFNINNELVPDFNGLPLGAYKFQVDNQANLIIPYRMSRGCNNKCSFCTHHSFNKLAIKSIDKVIAELAEINRKYKSNYVCFTDSLINFSYKYLDKVCDNIIAAGMKIKWGGNVTVNNLDKKLLEKMKKAGCFFLQFGVESGSDKVLGNMGKKHTADLASKILKYAHGAGINNLAFFIAGFPHETREDVKKTVNFIENNAKYIKMSTIFKFGLLLNAPAHKSPERYGICNLRSIKKYNSWEHYAFDEVAGLSWREKKKQQELAYKLIDKISYRRIMSRAYGIKFIPYSFFVLLEKIIFNKSYFYKLKNYLMTHIVKKGYSTFYKSNNRSSNTQGVMKIYKAAYED